MKGERATKGECRPGTQEERRYQEEWRAKSTGAAEKPAQVRSVNGGDVLGKFSGMRGAEAREQAAVEKKQVWSKSRPEQGWTPLLRHCAQVKGEELAIVKARRIHGDNFGCISLLYREMKKPKVQRALLSFIKIKHVKLMELPQVSQTPLEHMSLAVVGTRP